ncbi:MAG: hypothetical protein U1E56_07305 [Bauldia sp.]
MARILKDRKFYTGAGILALLVALGSGQVWLQSAVAQGKQAPRFEVDPLWPKPNPNNGLLGQTIGVWVDERDHVWIVHRGNDAGNLDNTELMTPPNATATQLRGCCTAAPPVIEYDADGNYVQGWGGPAKNGEYQWPTSNHSVIVDNKGFVWIGGNGGGDSQILKFTRDGKFVAQYGKADARKDPASPEKMPTYKANSTDPESFGRVAKIWIDARANEAYVADGYLNHRVAVLDMDTGKMKRMWGAYGKPPTDADLGPYDPAQPIAQQFRNPVHCANMANDGLVYVCDRVNDRIQIFKGDGSFVKEVIVEKQTRADGSTWDIAFSSDTGQRFLYLADGNNAKIHVFDRASMEELYNFGGGGRQPGLWLGVHSIATDSKGNIYTTETYTGKRVQKFVNKGVGPVPASGKPAWPAG